MNKESYIKVLKENRKLKDDSEIELFEEAIEKLLETNDVECLYCGFDNDTEEEEVMFGLIHAVESYYASMNKKDYFRIFIEESKKIYDEASEWVNLMNIRILNDSSSLDIYIDVVKKCSNDIKSFLKEVMKAILEEDTDLFQDSVNKFMTGIEIRGMS